MPPTHPFAQRRTDTIVSREARFSSVSCDGLILNGGEEGCLLLFRGLIYRGEEVTRGMEGEGGGYGGVERERFRGGDAIRRLVLAASSTRRAALA